MSEIKVNKISPRTACGTVTLGDSGDTFTIPSGATITNAGTASGFGATGETSWDTTVKTTGTFTATAGVSYFLNTTDGIITVNLPAGTAGDSVALADYARTWDTNAVTVSPNGSEKIGGVAEDATLSTEGQSVTFVYIDGTQGWVNVLDSTSAVAGQPPYVVATGGTPCSGAIVCTDYKVHTFTGPGTFTVTSAGTPSGSDTVDYMVVAGGGGGGGCYGTGAAGGGGGAGGWRASAGTASGCYTAGPAPLTGPASALPVSVQGYPITVGAGGTSPAPPSPNQQGCNGADSSFSTITSTGGGGGGEGYRPGQVNGQPGGSGGGAGSSNCFPTTIGSGNTPSTSPPQGNDGGDDNQGGSPQPTSSAGGGGGASTAGTTGTNPQAGPGGAGVTSCISATPTAYAGGGGGAMGNTPPSNFGTGGTGGGGNGGAGSGGAAGTINTGGGGGGGGKPSAQQGGTGGSGVVIIRYKFQN